ncbi:bifunctional helix-turn-helix transcriptional regulator/GNAT family N-acetyltransferase [Clostridium sediminicola]|uniref:GNAT family N-acetyltransferase n=1 Tax=Clostridium sediminicola TaxID=3114879 RepID=UPI0031F1D946
MNETKRIRKELRIIVRELGLLNYNSLNSGMTLVQAHILNYLVKNGETSLNELLIQLGCDKASLSRTIHTLESKNYIITEKMESDKRMKKVSLTPFGKKAIENGERNADSYIDSILSSDTGDLDKIIDALESFRILITKKSIMNDDRKIIFEKLSSNYYESAMNLVMDIFNKEQNIPKELIPISQKYLPMWWCIRIGEDIIGVVACWIENDMYHLGRIAIDKKFRKLGIGKKIIINSVEAIFRLGGEEIYLEARDITVKILQKIGGEIVADSVDFYGEPVTPVILKKSHYINKV